MQYIFM